ncbi:hypothetical protein PAMA_003646 [Pampus argenteus]
MAYDQEDGWQLVRRGRRGRPRDRTHDLRPQQHDQAWSSWDRRGREARGGARALPGPRLGGRANPLPNQPVPPFGSSSFSRPPPLPPRQTNTGRQTDEPEQPTLRRQRQTQEEVEFLEEVVVPPGRGQQTQGPPRTRDGFSQVEPQDGPPAPLTTAAVPLDRGQETRRRTDQQVQTGDTTRRTGRQNGQEPPEIEELEDGENVAPPVLLEPPKERRVNRGRQTGSGPGTEGGQPSGDVSLAGPPPMAITVQAQVLRDPIEDDPFTDDPGEGEDGWQLVRRGRRGRPRDRTHDLRPQQHDQAWSSWDRRGREARGGARALPGPRLGGRANPLPNQPVPPFGSSSFSRPPPLPPRQTNTGRQTDEPEQPTLRRQRQTQEEVEFLEEVVVPPGRGQQTQGPPRTRDGSSQVEPQDGPPAPLTTAAVPLDRGQETRRRTDQQVQTGDTTRRTGRQNGQEPPEIEELEDGENVAPPVLLEPPKERRVNRGRQTGSGPGTEGGQPSGDVSLAGPPPMAITVQAQVLRDPIEDDPFTDDPGEGVRDARMGGNWFVAGGGVAPATEPMTFDPNNMTRPGHHGTGEGGKPEGGPVHFPALV